MSIGSPGNPRIIYIYTHSSAPASGGGGRRRRLDADRAKLSPEKQAQLQALELSLSRIESKIHNIPSAGIRAMLGRLLDDVMSTANAGDFSRAGENAADLNKLCQQCLDSCMAIKHKIADLKFLAEFTEGPAKAVLYQLAANLERALDSAASPDDLKHILKIATKAVEIGHRLSGLDPKSREYQTALMDLRSLGAEAGELASFLENKAIAAGGGPGMARDSLHISQGTRNLIRDGVAQLKGKTSDKEMLHKLSSLEKALAGLMDAGHDHPDQEALRQQVTAILNQAAGGDVQGALQAAHQLKGHTEFMGKLSKVVSTKSARAEKALEKLSGPAKAALSGLLDKARALQLAANTPEDLKELDEVLFKAMVLADRLASNPEGSPIRSAELRQLQALDRRLQERLPDDDAAKEVFGADLFKAAAAEKASKAGRPKGTSQIAAHRGTGRLGGGGTQKLERAEQKFDVAAAKILEVPSRGIRAQLDGEMEGVRGLLKAGKGASALEALDKIMDKCEAAIGLCKSLQEALGRLQSTAEAAKGPGSEALSQIAVRIDAGQQQATSAADLQELIGQANKATHQGDRLAKIGDKPGAGKELKVLHDMAGHCGKTHSTHDPLTEALKQIEMAHQAALAGEGKTESHKVGKVDAARSVDNHAAAKKVHGHHDRHVAVSDVKKVTEGQDAAKLSAHDDRKGAAKRAAEDKLEEAERLKRKEALDSMLDDLLGTDDDPIFKQVAQPAGSTDG